MSNAIVDAITWDINNTTKSMRDLQTALNALQADWSERLPQFAQINSNGVVNEDSLIGLALIKGLDSSRDDITFNHFDPTTPDFMGEWQNVFGEIAMPVAAEDAGKTEQILFPAISGTYVTINTNTPNSHLIHTYTFTLTKPAVVNFYHYLIQAVSHTGANPQTISLAYRIYINGVDFFTTALRTLTQATTTGAGPSYSVYETTTLIGSLGELAAGTYIYRLSAQRSTANGTVFVTDAAPLPNVALPAVPPLGQISPAISHLEVIYL